MKLKQGKGRLTKSQRMQIKALVCVLGLLLLFILLLGRLIFFLLHREEGTAPEKEPHIPAAEVLKNVWIMETAGDSLLVFRDGKEEAYPYGVTPGETHREDAGDASMGAVQFALPENAREQIADVELTDGAVTDIILKTDKINGKILSANKESIEVEGYGKLPISPDYRGYRIYGSLKMCTTADLNYGYSFTDLVLEEGKVCGILMTGEEAMEYIRVLIKTDHYEKLLHERLTVTCDTDFTVQYGLPGEVRQETFPAGSELSFDRNSSYFTGDRVYITPNALTGKAVLKNVERSQGTPAYRGRIELLLTGEGFAVINEVLLEEYLYSVVPSEMPASYPDAALQAQAVCARTYAYRHMRRAAYPQYGAHVDDSTSYQVYNNIPEQESATTAAKDTYGVLLFTPEGNPADTYYYSTSCGVGSDANVWETQEAKTLTYLKGKAICPDAVGQDGTLAEKLRQEEEFAAFISTKNAEDFEVAEGWYRWQYQVKRLDEDHMLEALQKRYAANNRLVLTLEDGEFVSREIEELEGITGLFVGARGSGGIAQELLIETKEHTYKVITEYNIRSVLCDKESRVLRQDGSEIASSSLLPSAFFILSPMLEKERVVGYTLTGGGFGHGVGMSQNGAKAMAQKGYTAEQILCFFYEGCSVQSVYPKPGT